jgi:membrane associated rhomboid family serine protease
MIPLRDANPSRTPPVVTYLLIGANAAVFVVELSLGRGLNDFIFSYGVVPSRLVDDLRAVHLAGTLPLFSSMFLHGGWMHLVGNMLFLHVFGDNVEDQFGHAPFLAFYVLAGIAAALTQTVASASSTVPMVGASGAIAGVLGAYVLIFPMAKVTTLIPIIIFFQIVELPAFLFLGLWFAMQVLSGVLALGIGSDAGGVAWWAHIGGFAVGATLAPVLRRRR